ncbi:hypothetical protein EGW08_009943, partial [Elysia chlorotica]
RYTPCAKSDQQADLADDLGECDDDLTVQPRQIAIVGDGDHHHDQQDLGVDHSEGYAAGSSARIGARKILGGGGGGGEDKGGGGGGGGGGGFFQLSKMSSAIRQRGGGGGGGGLGGGGSGRKERGKSWGSGGGESESGTGSSRGECSGGEGSGGGGGTGGGGGGGGGSGHFPRATTSNNNEHYNAIYVDDHLEDFNDTGNDNEESDNDGDERKDLFDSNPDLDDRTQHPYQYYHRHHGDRSDPDNIDYEDNEGRRGDPGEAGSSVGVTPGVTANGPKILPPASLFSGQQQASCSTDRDKLIGERLSSCDKISLSSPIYSHRAVDQQKAKSTSKQSLLDLFNTRLDKVKVSRKRFSLAQTSLMKKPRPSDGNIIAAVTTRNQRRQRRKEIKRDFGKKSLIRGGHGVLG